MRVEERADRIGWPILWRTLSVSLLLGSANALAKLNRKRLKLKDVSRCPATKYRQW